MENIIVKIEQLRPAALNISFNHDFNDRNLLGSSTCELNPIVTNSDPNTIFLYVTFHTEVQGLQTEFTLDATVVIPFRLNPKKLVTASHLYECIQYAEKHLQRIFNAIFLEHPTPIVPEIQYDDVSETLVEHLKNLSD